MRNTKSHLKRKIYISLLMKR